MFGGYAVGAETLCDCLRHLDSRQIADSLFAVGEPSVVLENVAVNGFDVLLKEAVQLVLVVLAAPDAELRQPDRRGVIVVGREVSVLNKPLCGHALDQNVVDVAQALPAHALGSRRHADALDAGKMVVDFLVGFRLAVVVLVSDNELGTFDRRQPPRDGLNHADFTQRHIDAPADEGVVNLLDKLAAVDEEQHGALFVGEPLGDFRRDDGLSAAAGEHDARRGKSVAIRLKEPIYKIGLIVAQHNQNGRSSSVRSGAPLPNPPPL